MTVAAINKRAVLAIILISYFMILLDNSVIFTGLPSIRDGLHLSLAGLSWVQDAYTLVFGGLLLLGSRAGDILGRRRLFIGGLVVFAVASFLVGAAQTGWWLIAARAFQGIGAAIVAPTSLSLLTANFEGQDRSRAVTLYAATAGIGVSLGMIVGGLCADLISWRAGFYVNVPIAIVMIASAIRFLPDTPRRPGSFDTIGSITATLGVGGLVFGTINASDNGWSSPASVVALVLGVVFLIALVANERRAVQPIMPLRLFASFERSSAYLTRMMYLGAMMGFFFFITQFMQNTLGFSPLMAGLGFLPMTVVNFAVAMPIARLIRRISGGAVLAIGVALTCVGMLWLSRVTPGDSYWLTIALPMILIGAGQGCAFAPMTSFGIAGVSAEDAGAASGVVNTAHQIGSSLGLAVLVSISAGSVRSALTAGSAFLLAALIVSIAIAMPTKGLRRLPQKDEGARMATNG